jgi:hypothetical protein
MRALRTILSIAVFAGAFALNPAYVVGCGGADGDDADFKFSGEEMLALSAKSTGSYTFSVGGQDYVLDLDLQAQPMARGPSPFAASAYACGTREVFPTASACVDMSQAFMAGTLTIERVPAEGAAEVLASDVSVEGEFSVLGLSLNNGFMELHGGSVSVLLESDGNTFTLSQFRGEALGDAGGDLVFSGE